MEFWISGIIEAEVNSAFFDTMSIVQSKLDELSNTISIGDEVKKIRVVFIINRDPVSEYQRFIKKEKTLDARVRIEYDEFTLATSQYRIRMFVDALVTVLQKTTKISLSQFDRELLMMGIEAIK